MKVNRAVNIALSIVDFTLNPEPLTCIKLMSNLYCEEDPFSELIYKISKHELLAAIKIMSKIGLEGDVKGAIHRILGHIESAQEFGNSYYSSKATSDMNPIRFLYPWFATDKGINVHLDLNKMGFISMVCHKLLGSHEELLIDILTHRIPNYYNYDFLNYSEAISRLISQDAYAYIIYQRKDDFTFKMWSAANLIGGMPYMFPGSHDLIKQPALDQFKKFLSTKNLTEDEIRKIMDGAYS